MDLVIFGFCADLYLGPVTKVPSFSICFCLMPHIHSHLKPSLRLESLSYSIKAAISVLVCLGCYNKIPQIEWLVNNKFFRIGKYSQGKSGSLCSYFSEIFLLLHYYLIYTLMLYLYIFCLKYLFILREREKDRERERLLTQAG